jgi:hypothetical protein
MTCSDFSASVRARAGNTFPASSIIKPAWMRTSSLSRAVILRVTTIDAALAFDFDRRRRHDPRHLFFNLPRGDLFGRQWDRLTVKIYLHDLPP